MRKKKLKFAQLRSTKSAFNLLIYNHESVKKMPFLGVTIVAIFVGTALKTQAQQRKQTVGFDSLRAVKEIAMQNDKYTLALSKSDAMGVASFYTADARIINRGSPSTIGTEAIMHFYGGMIRNNITGFTYKTTGVLGSDNDLVVEDGTLVFSFSTGKAVVKGRYLLVWKRVNGALKISDIPFLMTEKQHISSQTTESCV